MVYEINMKYASMSQILKQNQIYAIESFLINKNLLVEFYKLNIKVNIYKKFVYGCVSRGKKC